jgi:hypothetical protein
MNRRNDARRLVWTASFSRSLDMPRDRGAYRVVSQHVTSGLPTIRLERRRSLPTTPSSPLLEVDAGKSELLNETYLA